jgi:cytidyltransferase-like protein
VTNRPLIGFTIGVFDLLHKGHINHIVRCYMHCDLLIIGVVTDYLVMMQKGAERPAESLETRMLQVQEHFPAAIVIPIDSLTLDADLPLICDVAFVGPDQMSRFYSHPANQFKRFVEIPRTEGISTTSLLTQAPTQTPNKRKQ